VDASQKRPRISPPAFAKNQQHTTASFTVLKTTDDETRVGAFILEGMSINGCTSTFAEMAESVLPGDMARLRAALAEPIPTDATEKANSPQ
jgi:hypothetical protein